MHFATELSCSADIPPCYHMNIFKVFKGEDYYEKDKIKLFKAIDIVTIIF